MRCMTGRSFPGIALPDMITLAGPAIGRETTKVIVTNPDDKRKGEVELGELEVIEEDADSAKSKKDK